MLIVVQSGIYRHGIMAACTTLEMAKEKAKKAIRAEPDAYHVMEIIEIKEDSDDEEKQLMVLRRFDSERVRESAIKNYEKSLYKVTFEDELTWIAPIEGQST